MPMLYINNELGGAEGHPINVDGGQCLRYGKSGDDRPGLYDEGTSFLPRTPPPELKGAQGAANACRIPRYCDLYIDG